MSLQYKVLDKGNPGTAEQVASDDWDLVILAFQGQTSGIPQWEMRSLNGVLYADDVLRFETPSGNKEIHIRTSANATDVNLKIPTLTTGDNVLVIDSIENDFLARNIFHKEISFGQTTTPTAPPAGEIVVWMDNDTQLKMMDSNGNIFIFGSASVGEPNTTSTVGTGEGTLTKAKNVFDLPFKSLKAGTNITITNNTDDVTIEAAALVPGLHSVQHAVGGGDPFVKGNDIAASARYLEDIADPASDSQRIWITDGDKYIKYWSDEGSPVKYSIPVLEATNIFTTEQIINGSVANLLRLRRSSNTVNDGIEFVFQGLDSGSTITDYGKVRVVMIDTADPSEDSAMRFQVKIAGSLQTVGAFNEVGDLLIGDDQRLRLAETGLSAQRIFTFPNADSLLFGSGVDNNLGDHYLDVGDIATPANPSAGIRRIFLDSASGKLSVRTSAGTTISLEEQPGAAGAHKANHVVGGSDSFAKNDNLAAAARYLEDVGDPASDSQRIWLVDGSDLIKYWSDEVTPVKHVVAVQGLNNAFSVDQGFTNILLTGYHDYTEIAAPSNPAANHARVYFDTADEVLKIKKSSGTVVSLEGAGGGGGDNITVNTVAATDADFDDATPAAPTNAVNIKWQKDSGTPNNISAYLDINTVSNFILADMTGFSVKAKATTGSGDPSDIVLSADQVLGRSGSGNIAGIQIVTNHITDANITNAKLANMAGFTVKGKPTTGSGVPTDITMAADTVLGRSGSGDVDDITLVTNHYTNDSVTFPKMVNIATDSLMGRDTAGTGDPENILLNSTLEFDGSGNLRRAAISGDITIATGSNTSAITAGAIVDADINASGITTRSKLPSPLLYNDQNNNLGDFYLDIGDIAAPANPSAGTRRIFLDSATGKLSVRTSAGATISLEEGAGGGESNTISNIGTDGVGVFKQKVGVDFELKKINTTDSDYITITDDTAENELDIGLGAQVPKLDTANVWGDFNNEFHDNKVIFWNPARDFKYTVTAQAITADVELRLPLTTGITTLLSRNSTDTVQNKTIETDQNTIKHSTTNNAGDLLKNSGTKFDRLALGSANNILRVNSSGNDSEWGGVPDAALSANVLRSDLDNALGAHFLEFDEIADPTAPAANKARLYFDDTDEHLKVIKNGGTIVDLESGGGGSENTSASNVGTGEGVFKTEVGDDLRFKSLIGGTNIDITNNTDDLTFDVPDGSTTVKGAVELATDGETAGSVVVQGNDARLANNAKTNAANIFTQIQTSKLDNSQPIRIRRDNNTVGTGVELPLGLENSSDADIDYARVRSEIVANNAGAEDGDMQLQTRLAGSMVTGLYIKPALIELKRPVLFEQGITVEEVVKTGNYTMTIADYVVRGDASAGAFTITLPTASGIGGRIYKVIRTDITSSTNLLTVDGDGSETIDGMASWKLHPGEFLVVMSNGTDWVSVSYQNPSTAGSHFLKNSTNNRRYVAGYNNMNIGLATTTTTPPADTLWALPFFVNKVTKFDTISFHVTTSDAGDNANAGIYRDNGNCYPGELIFNTGNVSIASTGIKDTTITASLQIFQPGLYWLAWEKSGTTVQIRGLSGSSVLFAPMGFDSTLSTTSASYGYSVSDTYGATLPDPYPGSASLLTTSPSASNPVPAIALRAI